MPARIVAVHSHKGGSGKSTTCANLAFCLHSLGVKTGVIDLDPQGSLLTMRYRLEMEGYDPFPFPVLSQEESYKAQALDNDAVVFLDFQPNVKAEAVKDFSQIFVVPFQPSPMDWNSALPGIETLREANREVLPVLTRYKNQQHLEVKEMLESTIGPVDVIYERAFYVRCTLYNTGVWGDISPVLKDVDVKAAVRAAAKKEILTLAQHVMNKLDAITPFSPGVMDAMNVEV